MDAGLKRRLVGAAVLIALAVIFVPMLLPSGSSPQTVDMNVPPPPSGELETRILKVGPDRASAGSSTVASVIDPDRVATLDLADSSSSRQAMAVPSASAAEQPVAAATAPTNEVAEPAPEAAKQVPASSASAPSASVASAQAQPVPGGAGAAAGTEYSINLGIYADHAGANKLVADARQHGFSAEATPETFRGKQVLRVRVGPYPSRAAAEAARLKLKDFEQVGMTVEATAVDQSGDAPVAALPASKPGAWAVQLAAFSEQASAEKLRDRLRSQGFDGYVDSVKTSKGTLWRVRAGPFATRAVAENTQGRIADAIKIKGNIVTQH